MAVKETTCPGCGITLKADVKGVLEPAVYDWLRRCKDRWAQPSQCRHLRAVAAATARRF